MTRRLTQQSNSSSAIPSTTPTSKPQVSSAISSPFLSLLFSSPSSYGTPLSKTTPHNVETSRGPPTQASIRYVQIPEHTPPKSFFVPLHDASARLQSS